MIGLGLIFLVLNVWMINIFMMMGGLVFGVYFCMC